MPTVPDIHRRGPRASQATLASPPLTVGTLYFVIDEGATERWNGTAWEPYSGTGTGITPPPTPGASASTFLVSGGQVAWQSAYTFRVSAAAYYINHLPYTSVEQTTTLGAAHATLDRIDVIALNTAGAVAVIAGTPSATPSEPSVDPAAVLKLAIVLVTHATSAPPAVTTLLVYSENAGAPTEWAWTTSGGAIVLNSTTTPHVGTTAIEGTSVPAGVYVQGTSGAGTIDPNAYDSLLLFVRSKATWNNSRGLLVTLRAAGVLVGASVQIRSSGTFGFDSSLTTAYQMVAIPLPAFAVPQGTRIDSVRIEDFGGAIGFYLDDVSFQAHGTTPVSGGLTQDQADARYAPLVHAPRHSSGGADAVTVTALAGYPGGTTSFLRADGTFAAPPTGAGATVAQFGITVDGGTTVLTAGTKGFLTVPYACTITKVTLLSTDTAVTAGTLTMDLWKAAYASYPPTVANTIINTGSGGVKPNLSGPGIKYQTSTLTGWTTAISAGDILAFHVDATPTLVTRVTLVLQVSIP